MCHHACIEVSSTTRGILGAHIVLRETTLCSRLYIISKENVSAWFSFYNNLSCFESFDALGSKLSCRSSSLRTYAVWLCQTAYFQHAVSIKRHLWNASLCASNYIPQRIHFSSGCRCERCDKKSRAISLCIYTLHHKWNDVFPHIHFVDRFLSFITHYIFIFIHMCALATVYSWFGSPGNKRFRSVLMDKKIWIEQINKLWRKNRLESLTLFEHFLFRTFYV